MRVFSAKVQDGAIVADEVQDLPEGSTVVVAVQDPGDEWAEVSAEEEAELVGAVEESDKTDGIPLGELLRRL